MHINASSEQHTQSIGKLLKNISTKPECVNEFGRWGLKISSEILLVSNRLSSSCFLPQNNINWRQSNTFHPLSKCSRNNLSSLCRWKVELCPWKTSAWSRHPFLPVLTDAGPVRLSGTPPSVLWVLHFYTKKTLWHVYIDYGCIIGNFAQSFINIHGNCSPLTKTDLRELFDYWVRSSFFVCYPVIPHRLQTASGQNDTIIQSFIKWTLAGYVFHGDLQSLLCYLDPFCSDRA